MPSILFICTANHYRSPIAAAYFRKKLLEEERPGTWVIGSAGTWTIPDLPASPFAVRLAECQGLSLAGHKTYLVSEAQLIYFDLILVMEAGHKEALLVEFPSIQGRIYLLSEVIDSVCYDVSDPARFPEHAQKLIVELLQLIDRGYQAICALAESLCAVEAKLGRPGISNP
jgi:protein-tyrosine phosphatase